MHPLQLVINATRRGFPRVPDSVTRQMAETLLQVENIATNYAEKEISAEQACTAIRESIKKNFSVTGSPQGDEQLKAGS